MAEACNIPVITCTSLEALSLNIDGDIICSIIDAKNNQVYAGFFDNSHTLLGDYIADDFSLILEKSKKYESLVFVGSGAAVHKEALSSVATDNNIHAGNVGIFCYNKFKAGKIESPDTVLPIYLRPSQAERMKKANE